MDSTLIFFAYALSIIATATHTNVPPNYFLDYKSGEGISFSITETDVYCAASHACIGSQLSTDEYVTIPAAFGAFDCSMTLLYLGAFGAFSAAFSDVSSDAGGELWCNGHSSCRDVSAVADSLVDAFGAYSMSNSTIRSNGDILFYLYGYKSGKDAKIVCQDGDKCDVQCFGVDACENLECIGAGCELEYTYTSTGDETVFDYDAFDLLTSRDAECNQNDAVTFDTVREHYDGGIITANAIVCCRGDESCRETEGISASGNSVNCAGHKSCLLDGGSITADEVLCSGELSCWEAGITSTNTYCLGERSCWSATISMQPNGFLDCGGDRGCREAYIESPGSNAIVNIQFSGFWSFYNTHVVCKESDICNIVFLAQASSGSITCNGQCNIECPQEFRCPGLIFHLFLAHILAHRPTLHN